jgi:transposase
MWCGIDWAQRHHDIAVVDDDGVLVLKRRIEDSAAGFRQLLELLAEQTQRSEAPIPIAMETAKGLLPATLLAAGYQLFPINPLAVSRYRDRYVVSRAKAIPVMRSCWPTSCALTWPRIARCPPTASSS